MLIFEKILCARYADVYKTKKKHEYMHETISAHKVNFKTASHLINDLSFSVSRAFTIHNYANRIEISYGENTMKSNWKMFFNYYQQLSLDSRLIVDDVLEIRKLLKIDITSGVGVGVDFQSILTRTKTFGYINHSRSYPRVPSRIHQLDRCSLVIPARNDSYVYITY